MPGIEHILVSKVSYVTDYLPSTDLLTLGAVYLNKSRVIENVKVVQGDYLRIHTLPKRFSVENISWNNLIVFEDRELLIINKPRGVPVHPTLDNRIENVLFQITKNLGSNIFHTHRLDIGTDGLLILTKNQQAQTKINNWLQKREIKKHYTACVQGTPRLGKWVHYMKPSNRAPKTLSRHPHTDWQLCELIVESNLTSKLGTMTSIELITGRSHQIRAQLGFEGFPIVGDTLYGGKNLGRQDYYHLTCCKIVFPNELEVELS